MRVPPFILFLLTFLFCTAIAPGARAQYVYNRADFPIAAGPGYDVAVADFNGDGILDLAVVMGGVESEQGVVSVLLGRGNGTFAPHTDYALDVFSTHILVGDFNGDGKPDLAVLNRNLGASKSPSVSILLANGDGTFQPQIETSFSVSVGNVTYMLSGDFNGDGKLDLVASGTNGQIEVLPGRGDGTFGTPIDTQATNNGNAYQIGFLAVGDFNGDGKLDVAAPLYDLSTTATSATVLLGKGDGTFQPLVTYSMQTQGELYAADVNHDGILDLVGVSGGISVLLGKGDGTFQAEIDSHTGTDMAFLTLGDFNGDGNLDAGTVVSNSSPDGAQLQVFLGDGTGHFQTSPFRTPLPLYSKLKGVGDFNGDGALDLVVPGASHVSVLLGNGDGTLNSAVSLPNVLFPMSVTAADVNGDGKLDLAIGEYNSGSPLLDIRLGAGDGAFANQKTFALSGDPVQIATADFNGDGKPDVAAVLSSPAVQIALGNGDGTFTSGSQLSAMANDDALVAGDFNGDGKVDLLVGGSSSPARLFLGNGNGTFQAPVGAISWVMGQTGQLITADFNHDGIVDIAGTTNNANTLKIFLGKSDGTFQPAISYTTDFDPSGLVAADFNSDGILDIAVTSETNGIDIFLGNGDGTFQAYTEASSAPFYCDWVAAGDFNGDGKIDLAAGFAQWGYFYLLFGKGDGTFSAPVDFSAVPGQSVLHTSADFNGDGTTDLAFGPQELYLWNSAPFVAIHPNGINFGDVPAGSSSPVQTVSLWNVGNGPLQIDSVTADGDFSQTNDCGSSVPVAGQCTVSVTFSPTGGGSRNATLVLKENAAVHQLTVPLLGRGTGLSASASPASLALGAVLVGGTSPSQTVTLSDTGNMNVSLSSITLNGPFALVSSGTTCASAGIVAANSTCTVAIDFTPTAGGPETGSLSFSDDADGSPQTVSLSGTGLDFSLAAASGSSTTATIKAGQTATYNLTVTATPGYSYPISFSCAGGPSLATCSVSPSTLTPSGSSPSSLTVTVTTTAGAAAAPLLLRPPRGGYPVHLWGLVMLLLSASLVVGLKMSTHRGVPGGRWTLTRMSFSIAMAAALLIAMGLLASGCGGGGAGGGVGTYNPGGSSGTNQLTLTGTTTAGATTLSHSLNLTLTVN